ncbi:MAG: type II toxin-antitoxin system VapC family toxin [Nitrospirae bacterium]|nr:type II toxin-antitoxin system VapC family toxin [Nitrospirota bacterium]
MSGKISLDTNIVIRLFKNDPVVIQKLTHTSVCLTIPVVAELLYGAENSAKREENLKKYNQFIDACNILTITRNTAEQYSKIRMHLKKQGNPIPENDLWIAASCIENQIPLITDDSHFDGVKGLTIKQD